MLSNALIMVWVVFISLSIAIVLFVLSTRSIGPIFPCYLHPSLNRLCARGGVAQPLPLT